MEKAEGRRKVEDGKSRTVGLFSCLVLNVLILF